MLASGAQMPKKIGSGRPPQSPLKRWFFRAPIKLYSAGMGWLLGGRFMLLEHRGRRSGLPRRTVIEVVKHISDPVPARYYACSGYGEHSDWFKNLRAHPQVHITIGRRTEAATARVLPANEAGLLMLDYAQRYPRTARALVRACGYEVDGTDADWRAIGNTDMRFIESGVQQ